MLLFEKWSKNDRYAIGLEDGRRVALEDVMNAARSERSWGFADLSDLILHGLRVLLHRADPPAADNARLLRVTPALPVCSSADYRTDAALGHFAARATGAAEQQIGAGPAPDAPSRRAA